jgi:hypothetical protein
MVLASDGSAWASGPLEPSCSTTAPAARMRGGDPSGTWAVKVTYEIQVALGACAYTGICSNGWAGYTCGFSKYCCPSSASGNPPASALWEYDVERNCELQGDDEFPNLGILITPGIGPDPAPHTVFGTARSR